MQCKKHKQNTKEMSPNLQAILDRLQLQLDSMSPEEYQEQLALIEEMNDGPTADNLIRSFHEDHISYTTTLQSIYEIIYSSNTEYTPPVKDYSLAA